MSPPPITFILSMPRKRGFGESPSMMLVIDVIDLTGSTVIHEYASALLCWGARQESCI